MPCSTTFSNVGSSSSNKVDASSELSVLSAFCLFSDALSLSPAIAVGGGQHFVAEANLPSPSFFSSWNIVWTNSPSPSSSTSAFPIETFNLKVSILYASI